LASFGIALQYFKNRQLILNTGVIMKRIFVSIFKYLPIYIVLVLVWFFPDLGFLELSETNKNLILKVDKSLFVLFIGLPFVQNFDVMILNKMHKFGTEIASSSIIRNIIKIVLFSIIILIILNVFGIAIAPILATLGVGGLAVALALQDTLADFFAGFYLIALQQVRIGNYIELDTGEKGYVEDINWRNTQIRVLANNLILIPNAKIMKAKITNYDLPSQDMSALVQVGVHYASDLEFVEKITVEVAKDVLQTVDGGVRDFEPFIRYHTFANSSINFSVILRVTDFVSQYLIIHEFIKQLQKRYKQENIVIPFPIIAVNNTQEQK
jgi:small-conductance mechanosensitive channel